MRVRLEDLAQHSVAAVLSLVTLLTLIMMKVMTVMAEVLPCVVLFLGRRINFVSEAQFQQSPSDGIMLQCEPSCHVITGT